MPAADGEFRSHRQHLKACMHLKNMKNASGLTRSFASVSDSSYAVRLGAATLWDRRAGCVVLGAIFLGTLASTAGGADEVVPGVWNYEVVVPEFPGSSGPSGDIQSSPENAAFEVNDGGIVVGRVLTADGIQRAFVVSLGRRYGLQSGRAAWLPSPRDADGREFPVSEALDIDEQGIVAGSAGAWLGGLASAGDSEWSSRGILWRLGEHPVEAASWRRFDPPASPPHGLWPQGTAGSTRFLALTAESPLRVVGYAGCQFGCLGSGGCAWGSRPVAWVVDLLQSEAERHRTEPAARVGAEGCPAKGRVVAVSRRGAYAAGSRNSVIGCSHDPVLAGIACSPTVWLARDEHDIVAHDLGAAIDDGTGVVSAEVLGVCERPDGSGVAVGYAVAASGAEANALPHAWWLPGPSSAAPPVPLVLPAPSGGGWARDIETLEQATDGSECAVIAVGQFSSGGGKGAIWFLEGASCSPGLWSALDANSSAVISGLWAEQGVVIHRLLGVNQRGDCVGDAMVGGVQRPVVLRAVRVLGDLDWDGCVGASDLAVLLVGWCAAPPCPAPNPATDLDRDGSVGASDLAEILLRWSCGVDPGQSPVPPPIAAAAEISVDFAAQYVGLQDMPGYRAWAETVPLELREVVDQVMWPIARSAQIDPVFP